MTPPYTCITNIAGNENVDAWIPNQNRAVDTMVAYLDNNRVFNVKDYGAIGNGVADDSPAIQAAIANAPVGSVVFFPPGSYRIANLLTVDHSVSIIGTGYNSVIVADSGIGVFDVTASFTSLRSLTLQGNQYANSVPSEIAIFARGTSAVDPLEGLRIEDCSISGFGFYGILLRYLIDFQVRGNTVRDIYYAGIMSQSVRNGVITENVVSNVPAQPNAYGIAVTRLTATNPMADPHSENVLIGYNKVSDVPSWEGLDTHSGRRVTFIGNSVLRCQIGIAIVGSTDPTGSFAPKDCSAIGNVIDSGKLDGTAGVGISFAGAPETDSATGIILGNLIRGHGDQDSGLSAAIYLHTTKAMVVSGNAIYEPSPYAFLVYTGNSKVSISGNSVIDAWSDDVASAGFLNVASENNDIIANGNVLACGTKTATQLNTYFARLANFGSIDVTLGVNEAPSNTLT